MIHEQVVALILAGGVGSRLGSLCRVRAKPAVPFGGIYRIIDFTLSNLMNSDIRRVGVLTQYTPLSLTEHIRDGASWDFAGWRRGIKILPPYTGGSGSDWYKGTADAVFQNRKFLKRFSPEHVLIVSGDHIYSMDYNELIEFHITNNAEVTISTMKVPAEDVHRFGVVQVDDKHRAIGFFEKHDNPPSRLASLGIYLFKYSALLKYLDKGPENSLIQNYDFGKDILPVAVNKGGAFAHQFDGYWQDVGTIQSYWLASMEFIYNNKRFFKPGHELRTNLREPGKGDFPCAKVMYNARISNSLICRGCHVDGIVENSILSPGVIVEKGARIIHSVVMHNSIIKKGASLYGVISDKNAVFGEDAVVGSKTVEDLSPDDVAAASLFDAQTVVGKNACVPPNTVIEAKSEFQPIKK